ncbi:MAG: hypothetical protein H7123_02940 [Thermoleophilia bacterium]|nr:hypothetical protein [Thermoleophilia bacterium]
MPMVTHAKVPPAGAASMIAASDASATVQIELAGGGIMTISLAQALDQGLVTHAANGSWTVVPGKATRLRKVAATAAAVIRPGQPAPPTASGGATGAAAGAAAATAAAASAPHPFHTTGMHSLLGMESGGEPDKPKTASEIIGKIAGVTFLARGLLSIAKGPGLPQWQTVYFAAHGLNGFTNHKLLPDWLAKGAVKDAMEYAIIGDMLVGSFRQLPKANAGFLAAAHGAGAVSGVGAKAQAFAQGAVEEVPAAAEAPIVAQTAKEAANVPFLTKLFPMMKPLYYIGMTASSVSSIIGTTEYMREHGTKGMMNTTTGRDAWIGALSGITMLGSMYMPPSPLQLYVDFASSALWMAQALNGHGVFDGLLGGDPKEPAAAEKSATGTAATTAAGTATASATAAPAGDAAKAHAAPAADAAKPAATALASTALAGMTASSSVPTVAIPTSHAARKRKHG